MPRKIRTYEGDGIVVEYDAARCIHAAECVHGLPEVFDAEARPWIQPEKGTADAIARVVCRCPTGALQFRRTDGGADETVPPENTARVAPDGPVYLAGEICLDLPGGDTLEDTRVALCRCGESKNKPFCDNSHVEAGFTDAGTCGEHKLKPRADEANGALKVALAENGPAIVEGPLTVQPAEGESATGSRAALCRCGASANKPYCDGSHKGSGFRG